MVSPPGATPSGPVTWHSATCYRRAVRPRWNLADRTGRRRPGRRRLYQHDRGQVASLTREKTGPGGRPGQRAAQPAEPGADVLPGGHRLVRAEPAEQGQHPGKVRIGPAKRMLGTPQQPLLVEAEAHPVPPSAHGRCGPAVSIRRGRATRGLTPVTWLLPGQYCFMQRFADSRPRETRRPGTAGMMAVWAVLWAVVRAARSGTAGTPAPN